MPSDTTHQKHHRAPFLQEFKNLSKLATRKLINNNKLLTSH